MEENGVNDNKDLIKDIPEMPRDIIDAIENHHLLIFVGAGLSTLFGYPLWSKFGERLIDHCVKYGAIKRSERSVILNSNFTPKQVVTISYKKLKYKIGEKRAQRLIIKELCPGKTNKINKKLVEEIAGYLVKYNSPILTTNADLSLDSSQPFLNKKKIDNCKGDINCFDYIDLFHIHGSINDFESMVFTSEQYAEAYMPGKSLGKNLENIITDDKTILFIGYSLSEFELLRYFLKPHKEGKYNHYILGGYLKYEDIKYELEKEYYNTLGIELLYYSREKKDYMALVDVLKKWNDDVENRTLAHMIVPNRIKEAFIKSPSPESIEFIKENLKNE